MRWRLTNDVGAVVTAEALVGGLAVIKRQYESEPSRAGGMA